MVGIASAVHLLLMVFLLGNFGVLAKPDDQDGINFHATYYEQPCCDSKRHVRHHKDHVKDFSCGKMYYRALLLDEKRDILYVGAMDRLFKLNLSNINQSHCERDSLVMNPTSTISCVSKGKSEDYHCRNHIRVIQLLNDGTQIYVCGTNGHNPKDYVLHQSNMTHLHRTQYVPGVGNGVAKCPYDPDDLWAAKIVEEGNPGNLRALYTATNAEFTKADALIFRSDLYNLTTGRKEFTYKRSLKYDSKWLDKPQFVEMYSIGEHIWTFFRESAVEYMNCGKSVYSRVARICKEDNGGKNTLIQNWTTFLKARLNCSIPGEFPFYFNELQSVYKVPGDDTQFYAAFTTSPYGLMGSAICSFRLEDMLQVFEGKFKEQATGTSAWLPVMRSRVPVPRPGQCVKDTKTFPDSVLNFIRSHPLMDSAVPHQDNKPVFFRRDVFFTNLVVDKLKYDMFSNQMEYTVYYAGTNDGRIYKIVQWYNEEGESASMLLDIFDITVNEPIRAMTLSTVHKSLIVMSDSQIRQIDLAVCKRRYDNCLRCVHDPYCGWDKDSNICRSYMTGLLQDVTNSNANICESSVWKKKLSATWGQSVHINCFVKMPQGLRSQTVTWYHYSKEKGRYQIDYSGGKYVETTERGLIVMTLTEADSGRYDCWIEGSLLCSYNITVDTHRCAAPSKNLNYHKIYSDWCQEFEKYKYALKAWEDKQTQCSAGQNVSSNQNSHPNDIYTNPTV